MRVVFESKVVDVVAVGDYTLGVDLVESYYDNVMKCMVLCYDVGFTG